MVLMPYVNKRGGYKFGPLASKGRTQQEASLSLLEKVDWHTYFLRPERQVGMPTKHPRATATASVRLNGAQYGLLKERLGVLFCLT